MTYTHKPVIPLTPHTHHSGNTAPKSLRESRSGVFVKDLVSVVVPSTERAIQVLQSGLRARHIACTAMNHKSSRAHAVFTLHLQATGSGMFGTKLRRDAVLNLVRRHTPHDQVELAPHRCRTHAPHTRLIWRARRGSETLEPQACGSRRQLPSTSHYQHWVRQTTRKSCVSSADTPPPSPAQATSSKLWPVARVRAPSLKAATSTTATPSSRSC